MIESLQKIIATNEIEYEYVRKPDDAIQGEEAAIEAALARLEVKERRIREAYEAEIDTLEEYKQNKARLKVEREELKADAEKLRQKAARGLDGVPDKAQVMRRISNVYELVSDLDVSYEIKGNALRSVLKQIVFDRKTGRFSFFYYAS